MKRTLLLSILAVIPAALMPLAAASQVVPARGSRSASQGESSYKYEVFAGYWPNQSNGIAKAFNKATKYVVTLTLNQLDWKKSLKIGGDVVDEVRRLKASDGPELHIWGSHQLLQTLIAAELIDEYIIMVYPVVIGRGKRLFENGVPPSRLALVETLSTPNGVLYNTYRSAGPYKP